MTSPEDLEVIKIIEAALMKRWPESKIEPSLDRISALVDALGSPQLSYPTVHIGGTNGKTSTSRMVDALFSELDYRTGRFTSPHLESFLERISIKGEAIAPAELIATYNDIALYLDLIDSRSDIPISYFEALTAMAFVAFAEHPVDIGIIEVGMGGAWDATNVVAPAVSVVTPIGMDHADYLGDTVEKIAIEKSGIIKSGSIAVLSYQDPGPAEVLLARAATVDAMVARQGVEFSVRDRALAIGGQVLNLDGLNGSYEEILLPLFGAHQAANASVALAAVEAFFGDQDLDIEAVRAGFANVRSPGRCEVLHRDPTIIIDAAHNPHGAAAIAETIQSEFTFDEVIGIFAPMGDKDVRGILLELEQVMDSIIVTANSSPRSMKVPELEKMAAEIFGSDRTFSTPTLTEAIDKAVKDCVRPLSDETIGILITGSVVSVGESRTIIRKKFAKETI